MIVVTGAAGRMGRQVLQRLVDEGTEVLGTDKDSLDEKDRSNLLFTSICVFWEVTLLHRLR